MPRAAVVAAAVAVACTPGFADHPEQLAGLRVLAVVAEPPEVAPGASAQLTGFAVDTDGAALSYRWSACPVTGSGVPRECAGPEAAGRLWPLGDGATIAITLPVLDLGALELPIRLDVRADRATRGEGDPIARTAFYRLRLGGDGAPNRNPMIRAIVRDDDGGIVEDGALVRAGDDLAVRVDFDDGSAERYDGLDPATGVPTVVTESLRVHWFVTAGDATAVTTAESPVAHVLTPYDGQTDVWAVAQDERGGTAVAHRRLVVTR